MDFDTWPRLLVVDVEGNGANPPDLVEVAAIPVTAGRPRPEAARSTLIRPAHPITSFATSVHHITNRDVKNAPSWNIVGPHIRRDLEGVWIAAHNASVDYRVLSRHLPGWQPLGVLDTLRLARAVHPTGTRHNLDALLDHIGADLTTIPGRRHRAGFDAHATALLLLDLATHYPTWDALVTAGVPVGLPGCPPPPHRDEEPTLW